MPGPACLQCERPIPDRDLPFALKRGPTGSICPHCRGARIRIKGVSLGRCIAESRESSVFEAVRDSGERCRVTVLRSFGPIAADAFEAEARRAAEIRHPNALRLLGFGVTGEHVWWAEESPPSGHPLEKLLGQKLAPGWSVAAMAQLADVLSVLAPIKAASIEPTEVTMDATRGPFVSVFSGAPFVEREGRDWARGHGNGLPTRGLGYMPLEQLENWKSVDGRSVVYRIGAILHHMLAGEPPYVAEDFMRLFRKMMHQEPPPIARSDVAPRVREIVQRCLARDPAARFATPKELAAELRDAAENPLRGT